MADINSILTEAIKAVALGVIAIVGRVLVQYGPKIAKSALDLLSTKTEHTNLKFATDLARTVFYRVEEDFANNDSELKKEFDNKADAFDSILLKKFPSLTKGDLDQLRQSVAGEYNERKNRGLE